MDSLPACVRGFVGSKMAACAAFTFSARRTSLFQRLISVDGNDDPFTSARHGKNVVAALNGAIGLSDMAGKAARVAVEPSGSERDTTPAFSLNGADGTSDTRRRRDWDSRG